MIFYRLPQLMLATLIQTYDKKIIQFFIQFKNVRLAEINKLSDTTFCDCINSIYQFIKPFLDNKMFIFEEHGAFKGKICRGDNMLYFYALLMASYCPLYFQLFMRQCKS